MRASFSFIAASALALVSTVAGQGWRQRALYGDLCPYDGWQHCQNQGAWGCVQLEGPYCVDQTRECDAACGWTPYAYQKDRSDDRTCVCSQEDASQPQGGPAPGPVLYGDQCPYDGWQHCKNQGAWGCVQLEGPNCVDQTKQCDAACGFSGYSYQKDR
ncbi:hypothetical protein Slin14017_G019850 [Septoria linicola]|nr:hypothetical protein Slin14017_G019850 [Septoria linicola]